MTDHNSTTNSNEGRRVWYFAPGVWAAIAVLSFVVAPNWRTVLADPSQGQSESGMAFSAASDAGARETSVPSASSVFTKPFYPVVEHVESF